MFRTYQYSVAQIFELDIIFFVYIEIFQLMRGHSSSTFNAERKQTHGTDFSTTLIYLDLLTHYF